VDLEALAVDQVPDLGLAGDQLHSARDRERTDDAFSVGGAFPEGVGLDPQLDDVFAPEEPRAVAGDVLTPLDATDVVRHQLIDGLVGREFLHQRRFVPGLTAAVDGFNPVRYRCPVETTASVPSGSCSRPLKLLWSGAST